MDKNLEISDGKVHAINKKQAYILEKIPDGFSEIDLNECVLTLLKSEHREKVASYVFYVNEELAIQWLGAYIETHLCLDIEYKFKPDHMNSNLEQYSTFVTTFNRLNGDEDYIDGDYDELTSLSPLPNKEQCPSITVTGNNISIRPNPSYIKKAIEQYLDYAFHNSSQSTWNDKVYIDLFVEKFMVNMDD